MKSKIIKFAFCLLAALLVVGSCCSLFSSSESSETFETSETVKNVVSSEDYEKKFHEELEKRLKDRGISSARLMVAHADSISAAEIQSQTRYTDKWLQSNAATGVGLGVQIAAATVDVQTVGEQTELRFKSFYECTGKIRIVYNVSSGGQWVPIMYETVTLYCPFVPEGANTWYSGTVTPPDMPNWSLQEGIYPNDLCFERVLDTGDTQYFIGRFYKSDNRCTATNYFGQNDYGEAQYGVEFNFWNENPKVIDSSGTHTFSMSWNHPIRFVSSEVNSIDYPDNLSNVSYMSNITVSQINRWYCSYVITNDRPENVTVINENSYQTYNNYDYRKFPIYRITNKNYQSYDNYSNYETKYYNTTYADNGITINNNNQTDIDYDVLRASVSVPLEMQFQSLFDDIYSFQPDIGLNFNVDNNINDYPSIVNPSSGDTAIHVYWDYPKYQSLDSVVSGSTSELPDVNVTGFVPDYSNYTSQTIPADVISNSKAVVDIGWNLFDSLGLIPFIIPLVLLAILWKLTGGE